MERQLNNLGENFVWIEAGGREVNGVRTGTHDTKTLVMADAIAIKNQVSLIGRHGSTAAFWRRKSGWKVILRRKDDLVVNRSRATEVLKTLPTLED